MKEINPNRSTAGLHPIIVDGHTDFGESEKRETNEEFIARIMNWGCPTGPLIQPFIIEALFAYCENVEANAANWPDGQISAKAWITTAAWLKKELAAKYEVET